MVSMVFEHFNEPFLLKVTGFSVDRGGRTKWNVENVRYFHRSTDVYCLDIAWTKSGHLYEMKRFGSRSDIQIQQRTHNGAYLISCVSRVIDMYVLGMMLPALVCRKPAMKDTWRELLRFF